MARNDAKEIERQYYEYKRRMEQKRAQSGAPAAQPPTKKVHLPAQKTTKVPAPESDIADEMNTQPAEAPRPRRIPPFKAKAPVPPTPEPVEYDEQEAPLPADMSEPVNDTPEMDVPQQEEREPISMPNAVPDEQEEVAVDEIDEQDVYDEAEEDDEAHLDDEEEDEDDGAQGSFLNTIKDTGARLFGGISSLAASLTGKFKRHAPQEEDEDEQFVSTDSEEDEDQFDQADDEAQSLPEESAPISMGDAPAPEEDAAQAPTFDEDAIDLEGSASTIDDNAPVDSQKADGDWQDSDEYENDEDEEEGEKSGNPLKNLLGRFKFKRPKKEPEEDEEQDTTDLDADAAQDVDRPPTATDSADVDLGEEEEADFLQQSPTVTRKTGIDKIKINNDFEDDFADEDEDETEDEYDDPFGGGDSFETLYESQAPEEIKHDESDHSAHDNGEGIKDTAQPEKPDDVEAPKATDTPEKAVTLADAVLPEEPDTQAEADAQDQQQNQEEKEGDVADVDNNQKSMTDLMSEGLSDSPSLSRRERRMLEEAAENKKAAGRKTNKDLGPIEADIDKEPTVIYKSARIRTEETSEVASGRSIQNESAKSGNKKPVFVMDDDDEDEDEEEVRRPARKLGKKKPALDEEDEDEEEDEEEVRRPARRFGKKHPDRDIDEDQEDSDEDDDEDEKPRRKPKKRPVYDEDSEEDDDDDYDDEEDEDEVSLGKRILHFFKILLAIILLLLLATLALRIAEGSGRISLDGMRDKLSGVPFVETIFPDPDPNSDTNSVEQNDLPTT